MFSELSCKAHNLIKITFPLLMLLSSTQPVHAAFTIEQVLNEPYFNASDIKKVRKGGFVLPKYTKYLIVRLLLSLHALCGAHRKIHWHLF